MLESLQHDGSTYYGPIDIVSLDVLPGKKAKLGDTGVPRYGAIIDTAIRLAPAPDTTYTLDFSYWRTVDSLSATNTTNWLLTDHPDIYLYGTLIQSAPYLKDDNRVSIWQSLYEKNLESLHSMTQNKQFGGSLRRTFTPIG